MSKDNQPGEVQPVLPGLLNKEDIRYVTVYIRTRSEDKGEAVIGLIARCHDGRKFMARLNWEEFKEPVSVDPQDGQYPFYQKLEVKPECVHLTHDLYHDGNCGTYLSKFGYPYQARIGEKTDD